MAQEASRLIVRRAFANVKVSTRRFTARWMTICANFVSQFSLLGRFSLLFSERSVLEAPLSRLLFTEGEYMRHHRAHFLRAELWWQIIVVDNSNGARAHDRPLKSAGTLIEGRFHIKPARACSRHYCFLDFRRHPSLLAEGRS